jgi:hypothetical protein
MFMIVPGIRSQFDPNADPILNPALDQDMADKMAQAEQIIAAQDARDARYMRRYVAPLAAVTVGLAALYVHIESEIPEPKPFSYSCTDFDQNVLKPPIEQLGFAKTGVVLDPNQLDTQGMTPNTEVMRPDGTPVKTKSLGTITNEKGR